MATSTMKVDFMGTKIWRDENGRHHRDGDLPAMIWKNGTRI